MYLKICGITREEDAIKAVALGVNALGFIFCEKSPRFVVPIHAKSIASTIPTCTQKVGVFVDASLETILKTIDTVGLDTIQLHGSEDLSFLLRLKELTLLSVVKAIPLSQEFDIDLIHEFSKLSTILVDSQVAGRFGGTGKTLDSSLADLISPLLPKKFILSGGLNPWNISSAINQFKPKGVDVSSGIEESPGIKNHEKMKLLVQEVGRFQC